MDFKSCEQWESEDVEIVFGITEVTELPLLENWLKAEPELTQSQLQTVADTHEEAKRYVNYWNEEELKLFLISRLLNAVGFNAEGYRAYAEQSLEVVEGEVTARGNVDFMVAAGKGRPKAPYFLLQEYKPERKALYDARGQLLIAMQAAKRRNEAKGLTQPIYGTYVIGRFWFFVILNGDSYAVSLAYDSTRPEQLRTVFNALAQVKIYIEQLLQEPAV